jgi:hypothetical protein
MPLPPLRDIDDSQVQKNYFSDAADGDDAVRNIVTPVAMVTDTPLPRRAGATRRERSSQRDMYGGMRCRYRFPSRKTLPSHHAAAIAASRRRHADTVFDGRRRSMPDTADADISPIIIWERRPEGLGRIRLMRANITDFLAFRPSFDTPFLRCFFSLYAWFQTTPTPSPEQRWRQDRQSAVEWRIVTPVLRQVVISFPSFSPTFRSGRVPSTP